MIDRLIGNSKLTERALDASWLRDEVISNNIANVDTPGFKKGTVKFEEFLANASGQFQISSIKKDSRFLPIGNDASEVPSPQISQDSFTSMRKDGNNVDIDLEMADLAKNTIKYNALIGQLSREYSKIKLVINEGRK